MAQVHSSEPNTELNALELYLLLPLGGFGDYYEGRRIEGLGMTLFKYAAQIKHSLNQQRKVPLDSPLIVIGSDASAFARDAFAFVEAMARGILTLMQTSPGMW